MARKTGIFSKDIVLACDPRLLPEARPAPADQEPCDVHRRTRERDHHGDLLPRGLPWAHRRPLVRGDDRLLAVADRALRELRGGDRRGPRESAGECVARDQDDDRRAPQAGCGRARGCPRTGPSKGRHRGHPGRRGDPCRRRGHRGRRLGRRVRHHRRVRPGHPRVRRRPLGCHRRHEAPFRPARRHGHPGAGQVLPRPDDRARRGRRAPQDAERDRAQHPPRRPDDHIPRRRRDAEAVRDLRGHTRLADCPDRAPRRADPDDDRRPSVGDRNRGHGPPSPAQRARDVRTRGRGLGRRRRAAPRQDRDDHAGEPPGCGVRPRRRHFSRGAG